MQQLVERLYDLCKPVVEELGLELVDVEWIPAKSGRTLRVYVSRTGEGRVGFDDCQRVTEALEPYLDLISELTGYTLEVASPGLDRVLKRQPEYGIFKGRRAKVVLHEAIGQSHEQLGVLSGTLGPEVLLEVDGGDVLSIPIENIKKCKLEFRVK
ncbi:MAG: Ribosome maturation factor RimP [Firmicutes bacterium]|nr:Ribosome maturation factor RimP [candidate division NPL-UPA2 bacterium]